MKCRSLLRKACEYLFIMALPLFFFSCEDEEVVEEPDLPGNYKQTVFMYMPWSGQSIYSYFKKNISSFETAIENNHGLDGNALIVFISENESVSNLIRITYGGGQCRRDTLRQYSFPGCDYTTSAGLASIISDVADAAPAQTYALAVGCHGMGWLPVGTEVYTRVRMAAAKNGSAHLTRFFGHSSDSEYQTDISTLAEGIRSAGLKMEYILFDDCYMSNIETAYELRDVTDYLIASTCEIMIEGMPYAEIGIDLLNNDFKGVCDGFHSFYSDFRLPCGTIGVTDCREVDGMVAVMRDINMTFPFGVNDVDSIQDLDGYSPTIFFDFGDYVSHLCTDEALLSRFNEQLGRLVPYKANTETYYSMISNKQTLIRTFSGLTVSDPTRNGSIAGEVAHTAWYRATHQ